MTHLRQAAAWRREDAHVSEASVAGFRLGSIDPPSGKSFTQVEYERAAQLKKSILIYLADEEAARVRYADIEIDPQARERLAAFKATLRERHTIGTFSTPEDLAEKIKRDFARELEPKEPAPAINEFEGTDAVVQRFMLLPSTVVGREVRVRVAFYGGPFPASRALCKAFNLTYGSTVGSYMRVTAPDGDSKKFSEMYATGSTVDQFLDQKIRLTFMSVYSFRNKISIESRANSSVTATTTMTMIRVIRSNGTYLPRARLCCCFQRRVQPGT